MAFLVMADMFMACMIMAYIVMAYLQIDIKKMAAPQAVFEAILNYGAASASRNASLCATSADRAEATVCTTTEMTIATLKKKHGQYQYRPLSI